MGYFNELPNIVYQSPLSHRNSSTDYIVIKNLFRGAKLKSYLDGSVTALDKYVINDGDRPDTIAEFLYGDSRLDYVVILIAGITNINHEWPLQDYQIYDLALSKYGSEEEMNKIHHYETFEIKDNKGRQILPPNLIVDKEFKIYGSVGQAGSVTYNLISQAGNTQLDDKDEYTVTTDNIARAVTNLENEFTENEKKRDILLLKPDLIPQFNQLFIEEMRYSPSTEFRTESLRLSNN